MKKTMRLIILLVLFMFIAVAVGFIGKTTVGISDVRGSLLNLKSANQSNGIAYERRYAELKNEKSTLETEKEKLNEDVVKAEEEYKALIEELSKKKTGVEALNEQNAYGVFVDAATLNESDLYKFFVEDASTYTVTYIGTLPVLNSTLETIKEKTFDWGMDIGNISIRQNYDAYNLERSYDDETRLDWYDYKIVNAFGEVISLDVLNNTEEPIDITVKYSTDVLDEVKFDTQGRDTEVLASNSAYQEQINKVIASYGEQLVVLENKGYDDLVEAEIKVKLEEEYNKQLDELKAEKAKAAAAIEAKYMKAYNDAKEKVTAKIKNYQDKIDELQKMLADSSGIEYRLDITLSYSY